MLPNLSHTNIPMDHGKGRDTFYKVGGTYNSTHNNKNSNIDPKARNE